MAQASRPRNGKTRSTRTSNQRRRKPKTDYTGMIVVVVVLIAAIALGPTIYQRIQERRNSGKSTTTTPKDDSSTRTTDWQEAAKPDTKKEIKKTKQELKKLLTDADALFAKAEFGKAADVLKKANDLEIDDDDLSAVQRKAAAAHLFSDLMKNLQYSLEADAKDLYQITVRQGGTFRAKVISQIGDSVSLRKDKGISTSLPRDRIASMKPITQEERNKEMRAELEEEKLKTPREGIAYFLLGKQALENRLTKEGVSLLQEAAELDDNLAGSLQEHYASRLFKQGAWFQSVGLKDRAQKKFEQLFAMYPQSRASELAREILDEGKVAMAVKTPPAPRREKASAPTQVVIVNEPEEEETEEDVSSRKQLLDDVGGKDKDTLAKANDAYQKGMDFIMKARDADSGKKASKYYKKAAPLLEKARDMYDKALEKDPRNTALENRLQQAGQQLYWCRKLMRL